MNMDLIFNPTDAVEFAGNTFINVPIILLFDDTPMVEMVVHEDVKRTTRFSIYNNDGVYLAKVVGPQLYLTADGEKAGLEVRHPDKMTVCTLGKQTLFEISRPTAAAIAISAELFTPTGGFIKAAANVPSEFYSRAAQRIARSAYGNTFMNREVGVLL